MIYREMSRHLQGDEPTTDFNFSLYLNSKTPFSLKSLLVIYYYYKEKKLLTTEQVSKMSLKECKSIEVKI